MEIKADIPEWITPLQKLVLSSSGDLQKNLISHFDSKLDLVVESHIVEDNSDINTTTRNYSIKRLIHVYLDQKRLYTAISITVLMFSVLNLSTGMNGLYSSFLQGKLSIGNMFQEIHKGYGITRESQLLEHFIVNPYNPVEYCGICPFWEHSRDSETLNNSRHSLIKDIPLIYSCKCSFDDSSQHEIQQLGLYRLYTLKSKNHDNTLNGFNMSIHSTIAELFPLNIFESQECNTAINDTAYHII